MHSPFFLFRGPAQERSTSHQRPVSLGTSRASNTSRPILEIQPTNTWKTILSSKHAASNPPEWKRHTGRCWLRAVPIRTSAAMHSGMGYGQLGTITATMILGNAQLRSQTIENIPKQLLLVFLNVVPFKPRFDKSGIIRPLCLRQPCCTWQMNPTQMLTRVRTPNAIAHTIFAFRYI